MINPLLQAVSRYGDTLKESFENMITLIFKDFIVDVAATTPFDTGWHAINWQIGNEDDGSVIEKYDRKNKRNLQYVLNDVSTRADNFRYSLGDNIAIFNNADFIIALENGTPTAGTGPNANPGFYQAQENTFEERIMDFFRNNLFA